MVMQGKGRVPGGFLRAGLSVCIMVLLAGALVASSAEAKDAKPPAKSNAAKWGVVENVGKGVTAPVPVFMPEPAYPTEASPARRKDGVFCVVGIIVDRKGKPEDVHVIRSGGKAFDANAIDAVKRYRFKPAMKDGQPVAVRMMVHVLFNRY